MKERILFTVIASLLVFGTIASSLADNVHNDVTLGGTDTITAGGSTTIKYEIQAVPATSCDPADGSAATVTINKPVGVTSDVSSLVFTSCGTEQPVVFSSNTAGDYEITVSVSDTSGSYNPNPAKFTLHVLPISSNTLPTLNLPGPMIVEATSSSGATVNYVVTASDSEDGPLIPTCSPTSGSVFALGLTQVNCSVTDSANSTVTGSFDVSVIDSTGPTIDPHADVTEEATSSSGAIVNYSSPATHDAVDGDGTATCSPSSGSQFALGDTTVYCDATDAAGNDAIQTSFVVHVVDTTPPVITWVSSINDGDSFVFGFVPSAPTCTAQDVNLVSEPSTCNVTGYSTAVGTHVLSATGTDSRNNSASETRTYTVLPWTMNGFYQPVDMGNVYNVVKGGSTVPLKFEIFADSTELTSTTFNGNPVGTFAAKKIVCDNSSSESSDDFNTTGGTSFRYDTTAGQFIQNWQTPKTPGMCYKVTFTSQDAVTVLQALFKLK